MSKPHLPQPAGRQRDVLYLPAGGHTVVLGAAGSGKTTLAMHRSAFLADRGLPHGGRVLLLSFNNALTRYLSSFADMDGKEVDVRTYHHFARGYLNQRGRMSPNGICKPEHRDRLIAQALTDLLAAHPAVPVLKRPLAFLGEEIRWLMQHGINSIGEYLDAERTGRQGARLVREDRPHIFALRERYVALRHGAGKLYDWDDLASAVLEAAAQDATPRMYRHIVVDEGQDFSPQMLRSLAALVPQDGSLTFFGDSAQQIYGNKLSWRSAGLSPPKVWEFEQNHRNTRQIAALALAVSKMPYFVGTADVVAPRAPTADGPLPALVRCSTREAELAFIGTTAKRLANAGSVAVLFETRDEEDAIRAVLPPSAIRLHRELSAWVHEPRVYYGTFAAAKGLEFSSVIMPRMSESDFPAADEIATYGQIDASALSGKRLYVGVTRARANLILSYTGVASRLLPDGNLYQRETA
jgi:superfamily I DNA/RNA helicase